VTYSEPERLAVHFELRELSYVAAWTDQAGGLHLHWFGLTDGWYDVQVGDDHLFRPAKSDEPGVDYHVVRIWEDLIEVAPSALEPVPEALAVRLATGDTWAEWTTRAFELEDADDLCETALSWWWARHMYTGHLRAAPYMEFWRSGEGLRVRWRSHPGEPNDVVWSSPAGDAVISADSFRNELVRFDRALIEAMRLRIDQVAERWSRPEVHIDLDQLRHEHADRSMWLERAMSAPVARKHTWETVLAAIANLEDRLGSVCAG
jgi:hypothetical protein